jgi:hypothetical protein
VCVFVIFVYSPQEIANTLYAIAKLRAADTAGCWCDKKVNEGPLVATMVEAMLARLMDIDSSSSSSYPPQGVSAQTLATAMWALAKMSVIYTPPDALLSAISRQVESVP